MHVIQQTLGSQFDDILLKIDKIQDLKIKQVELEVHDTYRKD